MRLTAGFPSETESKRLVARWTEEEPGELLCDVRDGRLATDEDFLASDGG